MSGVALLVILCAVMALASFFAGIVPLSFSLSPSQLRLMSSLGVGVLIGTALIVILPEGVEAIAASVEVSSGHVAGTVRGVAGVGEVRARQTYGTQVLPEVRRQPDEDMRDVGMDGELQRLAALTMGVVRGRRWSDSLDKTLTTTSTSRTSDDGSTEDAAAQSVDSASNEVTLSADAVNDHHHEALPTFYIGLSLILGFALMFLVDRLPRHATERFRGAPQPRHIRLDSLGLGHDSGLSETEDEGDGFLGSLTPSPRRARSLATTVGLVIHAVTDGIAMGASSAAADTRLGMVVFAAIMIHKAPVSFGLTSVLLSQGLSKRAARGHLLVFSMAAPVGALGTWFVISVLGGTSLEGAAGQWWTGMLLLFSAGTFL